MREIVNKSRKSDTLSGMYDAFPAIIEHMHNSGTAFAAPIAHKSDTLDAHPLLTTSSASRHHTIWQIGNIFHMAQHNL